MATTHGIDVLTEAMDIPHGDALRALQLHGGDVDRAANSLLNTQQRRSRTTSNMRAGPVYPLATPSTNTSPYDTDSDDHADDEASDQEDNILLHVLPTPVDTPGADFDDEEYEIDIESNDNSATASGLIQAQENTGLKAKEPTRITDDDQGEASSEEISDAADEANVPLCVCQEAHDDHMLQCAACLRWFHFECVNLDANTVPESDWYCHFEPNTTSREINRTGQKFDDLESRALYLTVKQLAPLGKHFWEDVSSSLKHNFNISRSHTSAKLEWLRNSSAIWGFDERDARHYTEAQVDERRKLMRSLIEGKTAPEHIEFRTIGQRKKNEVPVAQAKPLSKLTKQAKRKRPTQDSTDEDGIHLAARKRHCAGSDKRNTVGSVTTWYGAPRSFGGKYVDGQLIMTVPAAQTSIARNTPKPAFNDPSPATIADKCALDDEQTSSPSVASFSSTSDESEEAEPSRENINDKPMEAQAVPNDFTEELLLAAYPTSFSNYESCYHQPPLCYEFPSRFDALAAHRRHVKEILRDIEPDLDWYEGPWEGHSELLWTSAEEFAMTVVPE